MLSAGLKRETTANLLQNMAFTLWFIWKERNKAVFQKEMPLVDRVIGQIRSTVAKFQAFSMHCTVVQELKMRSLMMIIRFNIG